MTGLPLHWLISTTVWMYGPRVVVSPTRSSFAHSRSGLMSIRSILGEARRIPRYLVHRHHTNTISEDPYHWRRYLNDKALADLFLTPWEGDAWTAYAPRVRAEALTRPEASACCSPRHTCTLDGMTPEDRLLEYGGFPADDYLEPGDYASYLSTRLRTRLPDVREYSQDKKRHRTPTFYGAQAEADAPAGVVLGDVPFPPGMEVTLDPALGLGPTLAIPADLRHSTTATAGSGECHTCAGSEVSGAISEVLLCPNLYCQIVPGAPRDGVRDWQAMKTSDSLGGCCFSSPNGE
ncbi:hypothetical protein JCGZ_10313 [Jatropha curcas]|uniref:Aminotransferase-like plant mobile domain-containing protein n=1 Tax=Jatropha curcas TaxID=180498 RepID=A0A067KIK4_JATCU|nr:hypothetical protein JCGZ_10313 [Jatropha curcas]